MAQGRHRAGHVRLIKLIKQYKKGSDCNAVRTFFHCVLIELGAGGNIAVDHQQVEALLPVHVVNGGNEHTAGIDAHHLARGQVDDGNGGLADKILGLIVVVNAGEDHAVGTGAVVEHELQKLLALGHGGAFLDLDRAVVGLGKGVELDLLFEDRLALYLVDLVGGVRALGLDNAGAARRGGGSALRALLLGLLALLGHVERLHRREYYPGIIITSHKFL